MMSSPFPPSIVSAPLAELRLSSSTLPSIVVGGTVSPIGEVVTVAELEQDRS